MASRSKTQPGPILCNVCRDGRRGRANKLQAASRSPEASSRAWMEFISRIDGHSHRRRYRNGNLVMHDLSYFGNANATYTPPDFDRISFPPPAAMTTYWRPFTSYVIGVALPPNGSVVSHNSSPVDLS